MLTYAKTPKGVHEIEHRSHEIQPIQRRLLILVDGKRSEDELANLFHGGDLRQVLSQLEVGGYIQRQGDGPLDLAPSRPEQMGGSAKLAHYPELAQLPPTRPPDSLLKAKNFIINTISHFHSYYAWLDLKRAVQECHSHAELREYYPQWLESMQESRQAVKRLDELKKQLLDVL